MKQNFGTRLNVACIHNSDAICPFLMIFLLVFKFKINEEIRSYFMNHRMNLTGMEK